MSVEWSIKVWLLSHQIWMYAKYAEGKKNARYIFIAFRVYRVTRAGPRQWVAPVEGRHFQELQLFFGGGAELRSRPGRRKA